MSAFHFLRPGWLLAVPALLALMLWLWRRRLRSRSWQAACDPELLPHLLLGRSRRRANWPLWLLLAGGLLAVLALAGPAWRKQPRPLFRRQSALVILLDLSRSMAAADLKPSRIERARLKIEDLLRRRREGQTALVAFAGDAFVVTPLTDDASTIEALLRSLDPDLMPVQGSDPRRAMELGTQLLRQTGLQEGRVLLITDEDRPERAEEAARELKRQGYELGVLGVGTEAGAPIPLPGGGFFKDDGGNLVLPGLEEGGLRRLAEAGGGTYRRIGIDEGDIEALLAGLGNHRLDEAEKGRGKTGTLWREEGIWLLWPLALLAALGFRRGWLLLAVLVLMQPQPAGAFSWNGLWQRPDQQAADAFAAGDFDRAGEQFKDPRWKASSLYRGGRFQDAAKTLQKPQTSDDWYNRGNALARSGNLPQALDAYRQALDLDPDNGDARTNKELVEKALQQQQQKGQEGKTGEKGSPDQQADGKQKGKDQGSEGAKHPDEQDQDKDKTGAHQEKGSKDASREEQRRGDARPDSADRQEAGRDRSGEQKSADKKEYAAKAEPEGGDPGRKAATSPEEASPSDERQQATRQWLQRIPDDPGALLRRKFLYQYRQRGRQLETDRPW